MINDAKYRCFSKNSGDETLNDEKPQAHSNTNISCYESQNISYKNSKFFSIRRLFRSMEYTVDSKRSDVGNTSSIIMPKEVQPSYVAVNMPKEICTLSVDSSSAIDNASIRRVETGERSKKSESDNEESSQKGKKRDSIGQVKEDGENIIKNSPDDKITKFNPPVTLNSCDSNVSEAINSPTKPSIINKRVNSFNDIKCTIRTLKVIEENKNKATTSNPDYHIEELEKLSKSHLNSVYNSSFDNRYDNDSPMKKRLLENIKYNNNNLSDRTLSRNEKHINSIIDGKTTLNVGNSSVHASNSRVINDDSSVRASVNSMFNYKTMCNINQIDSVEIPNNGSVDGILKTGTLKCESQSYSSRIEIPDTEKMLDSDKFKNVGHERNLYDKKEANIKLHNYAQEIYDKYICPGSVYELNISNKTVKKITEVMSNTRKDQLYSEDIFNQAYIEVLRNIYLTSFQKFLKYGKEDICSSSVKRESGSQIDEEDSNNKDFDFN
ncbi:hypothetical protein PIROE2DRAFT_5053 [Piromyces sp. E2]|nr:hypothetical protein PIROE2DRAFT_5053 [Piromyces sp. E2]|eukprot:OUM67522.1 hypothetical protein PIROE2DRAFT_5053 [Piromyces sp. E2]